MSNAKRGEWGSRAGFILAAIGSAVGLGNIWRFPYTVASNGGGAFLLPYLIALLTAGIPILILEFSLGHKIRSSAPGILAKVGKKYEFLGWFQVMLAFFIATYYVVIIAWAFSFAKFSIGQVWGADPKAFLFGDYLNLTDSPLKLGGLNLKVAIPLLIVWVVNYTVIKSGVKNGLEKANKIFMPLLVVSLLIMVVRGVTLPGATEGLDYFFKPNFGMLKDPSVWLAAYGQIFFSLSVCFAIMFAYSSYLPKKSDIINNAFMTGLGNCSFSLISGIGVFSVLGYMAHSAGIPVSEVSAGGVGLAFVVFPKAISALPGFNGPLGIVFFASLIFAGFSSSMSIIEAVVSAISDKFSITRQKALNYFTVVSGTLSLLIAFDGGLYVLDIVDYATNQYGIVIAGLAELTILAWFFKTDSIRVYANNLSDFTIGKWWNVCIKVTPVILFVMLILKVKGEVVKPYEGYSWTALGLYGGGVLLIIVIASLVFKSKKGGEHFQKDIYAESINEITND